MSDLNPRGSNRSQREQREIALLGDLAKSLDVQHHDSPLRHTFGAAFEAPTVVSNAAGGPGFVGFADYPARADHRHGGETASWIFPTLENSWVNYGGGWRAARYTKLGNRVYIEGLVKDGTFNLAVLTLLSAYRPSEGLLFATITGNLVGRINIASTGAVYFEGAMGSSNSFCSLNCSFYQD
jgi:hypothetical protein